MGLEAERIKYWLGQGAQPTTRVARILGENELMPMPANGNNPNKAVPKKEEEIKKKEDNKEAPKAEAAPAAEAPKEEAPKAEAAPAEEKNNLKIIYVASSSVYTLSRGFSWSFI